MLVAWVLPPTRCACPAWSPRPGPSPQCSAGNRGMFWYLSDRARPGRTRESSLAWPGDFFLPAALRIARPAHAAPASLMAPWGASIQQKQKEAELCRACTLSQSSGGRARNSLPHQTMTSLVPLSAPHRARLESFASWASETRCA